MNRSLASAALAKGINIVRENDVFVVQGKNVERAVALNDLTNPEALEYAQSSLAKLGVDKALKKAGVKDGDIVQIGELYFEYTDDENFLLE